MILLSQKIIYKFILILATKLVLRVFPDITFDISKRIKIAVGFDKGQY
jgi:hypothetical protein